MPWDSKGFYVLEAEYKNTYKCNACGGTGYYTTFGFGGFEKNRCGKCMGKGEYKRNWVAKKTYIKYR